MGLSWVEIVNYLLEQDPGLDDAVIRHPPIYEFLDNFFESGSGPSSSSSSSSTAVIGAGDEVDIGGFEFAEPIDAEDDETSRYEEHKRMPLSTVVSRKHKRKRQEIGIVQVESGERLSLFHDCMASVYQMFVDLHVRDWDFQPTPEYGPATGSMSTFGIYNCWLKTMLEVFAQYPQMWMYFMCFDKGSPPQKADEQAERAKTAEMYPEDAILDHDGISFQHDETGERVHEDINIRRFMNTRSLRPQLYDYCAAQVVLDKRANDIRFGMDYALDRGPWIFAGGKCREAPEFRNDKLEADISAYHLALQMPHTHHILMRCRDRDLLAIGLFLAHQFQRTILFQQSPKELIDLKYVAEHLESIDALVLAAILGGCDYFSKDKLLYFIPNNVIARVTREHFAKWTEIGEPFMLPFDFDAFKDLITDIHKQANAERRESRRIFPSDTVLRWQHAHRVCFCFVYWKGLQGSFEVPRPARTYVDMAFSGEVHKYEERKRMAIAEVPAKPKKRLSVSKPSAAGAAIAGQSSAYESQPNGTARGAWIDKIEKKTKSSQSKNIKANSRSAESKSRRKSAASAAATTKPVSAPAPPKRTAKEKHQRAMELVQTHQQRMSKWTVPNTLPRPQHSAGGSSLFATPPPVLKQTRVAF